jgi:hypothetical protein
MELTPYQISLLISENNCDINEDLARKITDLKQQLMEIVPQEQVNVIIDDLSKVEEISASEAVYGFAAWLTTRMEAITIGAKHTCGEVADLVAQWCKENNLSAPREGVFPKNIHHPKD